MTQIITNIDVSDFLSQEDMKEIAADVFRAEFRKELDGQHGPSNLVYYIKDCALQDIIKAAFTDEVVQQLKETVLKTISEGVPWHVVFDNGYDYTGKKKGPQSKGWFYLEDFVGKHRGLIEKRVVSVLSTMDYKYALRDLVNDRLSEAVDDLFTRDDGK